MLCIDSATNLPKTGDAANLTCYVSKDHGALTALTDTTATEVNATNAPGLYDFDLTGPESDGHEVWYTGKSTTVGIILVPRVLNPIYSQAITEIPVVAVDDLNSDAIDQMLAGFGLSVGNLDIQLSDIISQFGVGFPGNFSLMNIDASGRVQVQAGSGTGKINALNGSVLPIGYTYGSIVSSTVSSVNLPGGSPGIDSIKNSRIYINSGTGIGQTRRITNWNPSGNIATVSPNWVINPDATSVFVIIPDATTDVTAWRGTDVPAPNTAGYPIVTHKAGSGAGEILLTTGKITVGGIAVSTPAILSAGLTVSGGTTISGGINILQTDPDESAIFISSSLGPSLVIHNLGGGYPAVDIYGGTDGNSVGMRITSQASTGSGHALQLVASAGGNGLDTTGGSISGSGIHSEAIAASSDGMRLIGTTGGKDINANEIDGILTTQLIESYNNDGITPTCSQALLAILQRLTEFTILNDKIFVKKLNGADNAFTLQMNSADEPTSSSRTL